jgi:seryl-tRNA synthetase
MSKQQLLEEVGELEMDLRERDDEIQRLTRELQAAKSASKSVRKDKSFDEEEELVRENEELREQLAKEQAEHARAADQLTEISAQLKVVVGDKIEVRWL